MGDEGRREWEDGAGGVGGCWGFGVVLCSCLNSEEEAKGEG